ncbi:MAG: lysophospholipase [Bacilli bacterium]|nr:lysophospholipase [Bacilli bacterium]MDD3036173.1 dienelactone hydrolase family protein [Candidatus Saccharimonadaceae bacterium]MDD4388548.1 dienelactone hydrolase family protein [Bacilli bacterium]
MITKEIILEGIPFTVYQRKEIKPKRLLFFFHGFTGERHSGIGERAAALTEIGFLVIAGDAYLHGERSPEFFAAWDNARKHCDIINIIIRTAKEIKYLYHKYFKNYSDIKTFPVYAYGVSMGAATAFYLTSIMEEVNSLVSILGSPSFCDFYELKQQLYGFNRDDYFLINLQSYREEDPLLNYHRLKGKNIFMTGGTEDKIVPMVYSKQLNEKLKNEKVIFKAYNTGHMSTAEMLEDSYNFLKNRLAQDE